ncbi:ABC transporter ATP-binding protein [Lachnospiraceae bacterium YH-ros2228]
MDNYAIRVKNVSKMYKLYKRNRDRLMDAFGLSKQKKHYTEHYALRNLSFDVKKGETVGIIGTNGAGKSTILKIITGVLQPTSGELEINGKISALLELGAGFNPEYTGIENVYLNGTMMGFTHDEIKEKIDDILNFADIGEFVYQPVKTYSSGMFVRLAFALAININPEILIVDEALSVGDVFFQSKCYRKFEEFREAGKTVLFVSHDLSSIAHYCDRVILLDHGRKVSEGRPKDMIDLYKRIVVHQVDVDAVIRGETDALGRPLDHEKLQGQIHSKNETKLWKDNFTINPQLNEYGNGSAEIIDFGVWDSSGALNNTLEKEKNFTIRSKIKFHTTIENPIFTFTIKNKQGVAITGTNTMIEKKNLFTAKADDIFVCSFTQKMNLQGGPYLLSISCTGYDGADFTVYHRLYDVITLEVLSDKNTVGFFDINSTVDVKKVNF